MALSNRIISAVLTLCVGTSFLAQAHGSNPALKLKIINRSNDTLTLLFKQCNSAAPDSEKIIKAHKSLYMKLAPYTLRAICTRSKIMTQWYNRTATQDYCIDIATLLKNRENNKVLEIIYTAKPWHAEPIWKY